MFIRSKLRGIKPQEIQLQEKLSPILLLMKQILYEGTVLHVDETHLQVLNELMKTKYHKYLLHFC